MRRISANYIYPIHQVPLKNGIIEIDDTGEIQNLIDTQGDLRESRNLEFYNGVITPGFINTHCHLELSGLKGMINENKGLPDFLKKIITYKRQNCNEDDLKPIEYYDHLMRQKGIVAVGDISNTNHTIVAKKNSKITYHTFVEAMGLASDSIKTFQSNKNLYQDFATNNLRASIVPHAPYSVSTELFLRIKSFSEIHHSVISIHNQESVSENQMFENNSGKLLETFHDLGIDTKNHKATGTHSVVSISPYLPKDNTIIFVHNTFSSKEDIVWMKANFKHLYWCLCPKSNLFIENKLPDLDLFYPYSNHITLGTDSLASNTSLSILDEMKVLVKNFDFIKFDQLIKWGTLNGAQALEMDEKFGSLEIGKSPGLNLISNFDFKKMQLTDMSEVSVLV